VAEHVYSLLCERVDMRDNVATLVNCADAVTVVVPSSVIDTRPAPAIQLKCQMTLVSMWRRSDPNTGEIINVSVSIIDSQGAEVGKTTFSVDLNPGLICRQLTNIQTLVVRGPGLHFFDIQLLGSALVGAAAVQVARLPLEVILKAA
jgi:hypothetical protein